MLESLKNLVEQNPVWVLAVFALSVVANILQVLSYIADRRRSREEARQREADHKRLATYEFLFSRADKQVMTEAELKSLDAEISKRSSAIPELDKRIELLRSAARREVVAQNIERNVTIITDAYEELNTLRTDHAALGTLPGLPEANRKQIEEEVREYARQPYAFPKSLVFRCLLLVLFIMLLPWPADTILAVVFLHIFLIAFFDAAALSRDAEMTRWILRHQNRLGLASAIGAWYLLIETVDNSLARPVQTGIDIVLQALRQKAGPVEPGFRDVLLDHGYIIGALLLLLLSWLAGLIHWRLISTRVLNRRSDV